MAEIPTWMKAENAKFEARKKEQEKQFQQGAEDAMFISTSSLDCWNKFTDEIKTMLYL